MDGLREKIKEFLKTYEDRKPRGEENEANEMYADEVNNFLSNVLGGVTLEVGFNYCESIDDTRLEASVYVPNLIGDKGYAVTVESDVATSFDSEEDFVEELIRLEDEAQKILSHFKK